MSVKAKILYCILDWGLGHATRSIPIIEQLNTENYEVTIGSSGRSLALLKEHFSNHKCIELPDYKIKYSKNAFYLPFKMLLQIPKILQTINHEYQIIEKLVKSEHFDLIISDNKFGCYSTYVPSIFITHQIQIKSSIHFLEPWIFKLNHYFMKKFSEVWIPDNELHEFSGDLSKGKIKPIKRFIGPLSRFKNIDKTAYKYKYCAILSGPEPQRTYLEKDLSNILHELNEPSILICGKTENESHLSRKGHLNIYNHLNSDELNKVINESEIIISRAGYSSIMDYIHLKKNAILIPTPGQTEQEYLAEYLSHSGQFIYSKTPNKEIIKKATFNKVAFKSSNINFELIISSIQNLISSRNRSI